ASPWLNLYEFPAVADYRRSRPLGASWHRLESSVRGSEAAFDVLEHLALAGSADGRALDDRIIYLSLGSLGCMDVALMQRVIDALDATPHHVVVAMGPLKDELRLGPRMYGDEFLPQPSILPQCDLLITHGGNNTVCEGFHFGLPMIGLPLFWDQYDNAQRLQETGFGVRLPTYDWDEADLVGAVDALLADERLHGRLQKASAAIRASDGRRLGSDLIERLAIAR
ncbi:MAG TPA: nucleotide disphospho-sugar-binding domain-containing protein, partial [Thermoleophilia bacterium]|nr:nucleotide disphospho-sugar-binding domain-containing protein [Thermoleophilia bacterium]